MERPRINDSDGRKQSILNNTPAIFDIRDDGPNIVGEAPFYELEIASQVHSWCSLIASISKSHRLDSNLVASIMYIETTHGWYDKAYPFKKTILPMNVHYAYWKELGVTKENLACKHYNIEFGTILIARIADRIINPTVRKIATIYNFLGAERVNEYGARVERIYQDKPWVKKQCYLR